jgi:hypothetical protein
MYTDNCPFAARTITNSKQTQPLKSNTETLLSGFP